MVTIITLIKSVLLIFLTLGLLTSNPSIVMTNTPSHILITEVLYDAPSDDSTEEWIELFNPTNGYISFEGWEVQDNVGTFALSGTIQAGGYFVIAKDGSVFKALYGFSPDISGMTLALGNSGDVVRLVDPLNNEIDMVAWENEIYGWDISAVDSTIFRIDNTDSDSVTDWAVSNSIGDPGIGAYTKVAQNDFIPPILSIDNLINGSVVSGIFRISVSATDASGIAEFEIYIDDQLKSSTNIYNWNTINESNGSHSVLVRARDNAGNWGQLLINLVVNNSNYIPLTTDEIKFMIYNIEVSGSNPDWIDVVKEENPDIVVFVETGDWDNNNDVLFQKYLNDFNTYFTGENQYFGNTGQNIPGATSGEAIMSRYPIEKTTQLTLVTLDDGTSFDPSHDFMVWEIDVAGTRIYIIGSHLKCCGGANNEEKRERAQEGIINYMDTLGNVPIIYAGDLNSFSPFDTGVLAPKGDLSDGPLTMMLEPQDTFYGQYSSTVHNFIDVFRELNPGTIGYTYGHQDPRYDSRIDFIIANQFFFDKIISSTTGDTETAKSGSDHYTVDVIIDFETTGTETSNSQTSFNPISNDSGSSNEDEASGFTMIPSFTGIMILLVNVYKSRSRTKSVIRSISH